MAGTVVVVVVAGFLLSLGAETLQCYIVSRHSSASDLLCNTLGTVIGVMAARFVDASLVSGAAYD